jgi:hypothetical protein
MTRLAAIFAVFAVLPAVGCYAPDRMPAGMPQQSAAQQEPDAPVDECVGDCQICADYCATMIVCSTDPPQAQDCLEDCFYALDASTPECSDARRDAMECVGSLTCDEFVTEGSCAGEFEDFTVQCEGEYDEESEEAPRMIAG